MSNPKFDLPQSSKRCAAWGTGRIKENKLLNPIVNFNEIKSLLRLNHLINRVLLVSFYLVIFIFQLAYVADPLQLC